jgi:hypothetical protein
MCNCTIRIALPPRLSVLTSALYTFISVPAHVQEFPNNAVVMLHKLQGLQKVEVSKGKDLRGLSVVSCKQLTKVVLKGVASLEQLTIADCNSLEALEGLSKVSTSLKRVELQGCKVCSQHCKFSTNRPGYDRQS